MRTKFVCAALPVVAALFLAAPAMAQSTWYVRQGGRPPGAGTRAEPYTSIQYALDAATTMHGDTILVAPGTYIEMLRIQEKSITLQSTDGAAVTIIDAHGAGSVVSFTRPVTTSQFSPVVRGFTLTGGAGSRWGGHTAGGAVFVQSACVALDDCILRGNRAELGAGVFSDRGTVTLRDCILEDNIAGTQQLKQGHGGALYAKGGAVGLFHSTVQRNKAGRGGGLYLDGVALQIVKCRITENLADVSDMLGQPAEGGGMFVLGASQLDVLGTSIGQNVAFGKDAMGGGVRLAGGQAQFDQCSFHDNATRDSATGWGAGIAADAGVTLLVTYSEFARNWASSGGGAWGVGEYRDCEFIACRAGDGAGVYALHGMRLVDCIFEGNEARSAIDVMARGGAVFGPATLERCTLSNNTAWGEGGGAFGAKLYDCTLNANRAVCADIYVPASGGGACESGLVRCQLIDNFAGPLIDPLRTYGFGGGVARSNLGHSVVARNSAYRGGGVYNSTVEDSTIVLNEAFDMGDGIYFDAAAAGFCVHDSIVWDNGGQEILDLSGRQPVTYSDVQGGWRGLGNLDADPMFWSTAQNDFHLKPGSPCIDTGDPSGRPDPNRSAPDIGALHYDPTHCGVPASFCTGVKDSRGCTPTIGYTGLPAMQGADDFHVTADDVLPGTAGLLMWSLVKGATPADQLACYLMCIAPPLFATTPQGSGGDVGARGCSGSFSFHFSRNYMTQMGLGLGTTVYCQYWYRDPGGRPPMDMGRTDALEFTICPVGN